MIRSIKDKLFYRGFAVAVGTLAKNGYPNLAIDIMNCNGVTLQDLKRAGAQEFDLKPLRKELRLHVP